MLSAALLGCTSDRDERRHGEDRLEGADTGTSPVEVSLLADVTALVPGERFRLAARFAIAPGWHIYWVNPGMSGIATRLKLAAPDGFELGPVRYPGPKRFISQGDIVSYGYDGEALLVVTAVTPATVDPTSPATFTATARWLACAEACIPGKRRLSLELPLGTDAEPAHREVFARAERHLPRPIVELAEARVGWREPALPAVLSVAVPDAHRLEVFPASGEVSEPLQPSTGATSGTRLEVLFERIAGEAALPRAQGVLAVQAAPGDAAQFFELDLPWPADRTAPAARTGGS